MRLTMTLSDAGILPRFLITTWKTKESQANLNMYLRAPTKP